MTRLHKNFAKLLMKSFRGMNCILLPLFFGTYQANHNIWYGKTRVTSNEFRFESLKDKLNFKSASCEFKSTSY